MLNDDLGDMKESLKEMLDYSDRAHHKYQLMQETLNVIASGSWETIYAYCEKHNVNTHRRNMEHSTILEALARHTLGQIEDA